MNLFDAIRGIRETARYVGAGRPNEQRIIEAMCERLREIVDPGECEVSSDGKSITLAGINGRRGNRMHLVPFFALRAPLPAERRLDYAFTGLARSTQQFLTGCDGSLWPTPGAEPHVAITDDEINVWWGGSAQGEAVVRLRPFDRAELEI